MKEFLTGFILLFVLSVNAFSQEKPTKWAYWAEQSLGVGFGIGPNPAAYGGSTFTAVYKIGELLSVGAGAGIRASFPTYSLSHINAGVPVRDTFIFELDFPVYVRAGLVGRKAFFFLDAGYTLGALGLTLPPAAPVGLVKTCNNGFFFDPQIGYKLGKHSAISLGVLIQNTGYRLREKVREEDSFSEVVKTATAWTTAINIRYAYVF